MKQSKKLFRRTFLILIIILVFKLTYDYFLSTKAYIKKVSGIDFPAWTSTIQTVSLEIAVLGKYEIPNSKIEEFIAINNFQTVGDSSEIKIGFQRELKPINRPNKSKGSWMRHADCNEQNHWDLLLNKDTGEIWAVVIFPDWSGDIAPCEK